MRSPERSDESSPREDEEHRDEELTHTKMEEATQTVTTLKQQDTLQVRSAAVLHPPTSRGRCLEAFPVLIGRFVQAAGSSVVESGVGGA